MKIPATEVQMLLAEIGEYDGGIDGDVGPLTMKAVARVLPSEAERWSLKRRLHGAAQEALNRLGYEAGIVDGYVGVNTNEALRAWRFQKVHGKAEQVSRATQNRSGMTPANLPRQSEMDEFYGKPGDEIRAQLVTVALPFPMRLDYNLRQKVKRVTLHRLCAPSYIGALEATRDHYGLEAMTELGIDRYAGGYTHRKMRGSGRWSTHAYGCAVDHYAAPNGLRVTCPQALFCGADYKAFLDIMQAHNWLPAIRLWGKDAMHFQQARLG